MRAPADWSQDAAIPRAASGSRLGHIALDFPRGTGAALFRRGGSVLAVFDNPSCGTPKRSGWRRPPVSSR
jgi:hypothetical protein